MRKRHSFPAEDISAQVSIMRTVSNEVRVGLLETLTSKEYCVNELQDLTGLSQSALSQHLSRLRTAHLVTTRRSAQQVYYRAADPLVGELLTLLRALSNKS